MSILALTSPFDALSLGLRIGSIGVAISSLESLLRREDLGPRGLLEHKLQRPEPPEHENLQSRGVLRVSRGCTIEDLADTL